MKRYSVVALAALTGSILMACGENEGNISEAEARRVYESYSVFRGGEPEHACVEETARSTKKDLQLRTIKLTDCQHKDISISGAIDHEVDTRNDWAVRRDSAETLGYDIHETASIKFTGAVKGQCKVDIKAKKWNKEPGTIERGESTVDEIRIYGKFCGFDVANWK